MKVLQTVVENSEEGFLSLMGQNVTLFCANYIYAGKLVGVNDSQLKLEDAKIVYETGAFSTKDWKDAQQLPNAIYVRFSAIEMYTVLK
jgi:hypothetical protein